MAQESAPEAAPDIRRKAAIRLGIAALVTALALGALWWLDQSGKEKNKPKATTPSPIVSAPAPTPPTAPVEPATPEPAPGDDRQPPAEEAPATPPPSPEAGLPAPAKAAPPPPRVARHIAITETPGPGKEPTSAPKPAPAQSGGSYLVQLGVFSNPVNAQELVERLKKLGIQAYTETRVQVGPFKNKAEAERAQAELKRLGVSALVGTTK